MNAFREQRLESRHQNRLPVRIQFDEFEAFSGETLNISKRGLSIRVPTFVPPYSTVSMGLDLPLNIRKRVSIQMEGLVTRSVPSSGEDRKGEYDLGLFFLGLDHDRASLINQFLNKQDQHPSLTLKERHLVGQKKVEPHKHEATTGKPHEILKNSKLTRLDRLACLGELASILAHEIKNPLAGLAGTLQILADEIKGSSCCDEILPDLFNQVDRIDTIVDHLLQFSLTESPQLRNITLEGVINETLCLLGQRFQQKNVTIDLCHGVSQPRINADEKLLRQAFLNMLVGVLEQTEENGHLSIHTFWDAKQTVCSKERCECVSILDGNLGVSVAIVNSKKKDVRSRINFDTSQVSMAEQKQRQLNLSLANRIIEQHEGQIFYRDSPLDSAVLLVSIPAA